MKRKLIFLVIFCCLFLTGCKSKEQEENVPQSFEINGIVTNASMNTLEIKDNLNRYLLFSTMNLEKESMKIGDTVKLNGTGSINYHEIGQDVSLEKIEITNKTDRDSISLAWLDNGIFKDFYDSAYAKLKTMSLEEKIGQIFLVRVPEKNQVNMVKQYHFGGYILFGRDTKNKTKDQLVNEIDSYQNASKTPLLIAVDEEGGTVVRVSSNKLLSDHKYLSPQEVFQNGGLEAITTDTQAKNTLLSSLHINLNLAPVSDVSTNQNDYMYDRTFGKSASETAKFVETVIKASKSSNVSYTLKHFPGYGNNVNTHTGISNDERSLDEFEKVDFLPFQAGIKNGAESILVNHNIIKKIEDGIPASLSPKVHNILRHNLGFTGIIMTDDIAMSAIHDYVEKPSVKALLSGNDLIIISDFESGISEIKDALNNGVITENLLDSVVFRVLAWKYYKGLINQ